ncbi:hypothetical protein CCANI_08190 [Corynebacterium canis]|nr:hypothetical protein CCANI_08190 [Corynebacterium canis]
MASQQPSDGPICAALAESLPQTPWAKPSNHTTLGKTS